MPPGDFASLENYDVRAKGVDPYAIYCQLVKSIKPKHAWSAADTSTPTRHTCACRKNGLPLCHSSRPNRYQARKASGVSYLYCYRFGSPYNPKPSSGNRKKEPRWSGIGQNRRHARAFGNVLPTLTTRPCSRVGTMGHILGDVSWSDEIQMQSFIFTLKLSMHTG